MEPTGRHLQAQGVDDALHVCLHAAVLGHRQAGGEVDADLWVVELLGLLGIDVEAAELGQPRDAPGWRIWKCWRRGRRRSSVGSPTLKR